VFVLIIRKLYWLQEPAVFRPWAYRIASRRAFQLLKRERCLGERIENDASLSSVAEGEAEEAAADSELVRRLPELVRATSPASRTVLCLHYFEEMSLQEVADVLEISLAAVKSRLAYGLSVLRKKLGVRPEKGPGRRGP
jgi:RNA polymerase sigma-70 factor (ECF subfamily)